MHKKSMGIFLIIFAFAILGLASYSATTAQTITPPIAASQALTLKTGLNFISFTIEPNITPEQLQAQNSAIKEIYYFDAAAGSFLTLSRGELKTLSAGRGYIIESSADLLINLSGQQLGTLGNIDLKAGFNLVGFSKMPEQIKFSELMNRYSEIKGLYKFNTMAGSFVSAVRNDSGEVMLLDGADPEFKAGEAVFVKLEGNTTINYDYLKISIGKIVISSETPVEVISGFNLLIKSNNIESAAVLFASDTQERMQKKMLTLNQERRNKLGEIIANATIVSQTPEKITYKASIKLPNGRIVNPVFNVILENGSWKMSEL